MRKKIFIVALFLFGCITGSLLSTKAKAETVLPANIELLEKSEIDPGSGAYRDRFKVYCDHKRSNIIYVVASGASNDGVSSLHQPDICHP